MNKQLENRRKSGEQLPEAELTGNHHPPFPPQSTKIKRVVKQKFSPEVRNKLKKEQRKGKVEKVREFVPAVAMDIK